MTANITNQQGFLRTSRNYPPELSQLAVEVSKSYIDVANAVNIRVIGLFAINKATVGGESWFLTNNQRQQNLRQVYKFADGNLVIPHGLNLKTLTNFVRIWGTFFDGVRWQTLPYVDVLNVTNQITVNVDVTNINIIKGAGAPPACQNGLVIIEWISNP